MVATGDTVEVRRAAKEPVKFLAQKVAYRENHFSGCLDVCVFSQSGSFDVVRSCCGKTQRQGFFFQNFTVIQEVW